MIKYIFTLLVLLGVIGTQSVVSLGEQDEELLIIPRASWGANSLYNDVNSDYWVSILESWENYTAPYKSPET